MMVTEKCDVYSFGVVAMEVIMGEHPGELILNLSTTLGQTKLLKDVLDRRLPLPNLEIEEIVSAVVLALACTRPDPKSRPTMRCVSQKLSVFRPPLLKPFDALTLTDLITVQI